mmetsp:Transcript_2524/g.4687  ORF Transcript_2524/g.4687 Transcript_2524/m.4687 type:complete len:112 (-) Transcript_2524:285-620(-)
MHSCASTAQLFEGTCIYPPSCSLSQASTLRGCKLRLASQTRKGANAFHRGRTEVQGAQVRYAHQRRLPNGAAVPSNSLRCAGFVTPCRQHPIGSARFMGVATPVTAPGDDD